MMDPQSFEKMFADLLEDAHPDHPGMFLDAFLHVLGQTGAENSPRDHLEASIGALRAARKLGGGGCYIRALDNFGRAMKRVREL